MDKVDRQAFSFILTCAGVAFLIAVGTILLSHWANAAPDPIEQARDNPPPLNVKVWHDDQRKVTCFYYAGISCLTDAQIERDGGKS